MRILLFNLATDADDPILGFTSRWISAVAAHAEFVHVITMRAGRLDVPSNVRVYSVGKEKGYSEARRAVEFYRLLLQVLRRDRIDVCFSHMMPLFTVLAALVLKTQNIPIVTWYAHLSLTWTLKMAHRLSDQMIASVPTAYPYKRDKLIAVGQGIDTELFSPSVVASLEDQPIVLCSTRLSPVKDHPTLLKAAWLLRQRWKKPFRVIIVGGAATAGDEPYIRSLHEQVKELGLEDLVRFEPAVSMEMLPDWYHRCTVHVNMTPTGSGDKVVWEALSCAKISLAANEGFKETFGTYADLLLFPYGDAEQLAAGLNWVLSLNETERRHIELYLREQVIRMHGLDRLAAKLMDLFSHCAERRLRHHGRLKTREAISRVEEK